MHRQRVQRGLGKLYWIIHRKFVFVTVRPYTKSNNSYEKVKRALNNEKLMALDRGVKISMGMQPMLSKASYLH